MSLTHEDAGSISNLHSHSSRRTTRNYRDASGTTGSAWRNDQPTPIQPPGRGLNPYSGRLTTNKDNKTATSSSSQHASKRQKLDHEKGVLSRHFLKPPSEPRTRSQRAQVVVSSSPSRPGHATDAIVIDEDDTPDLNDSSSKPDTLTTSSPDPADLISQRDAYSFDTSKPTPMAQYSSSFELEEMLTSPTDGESTARVRQRNKAKAPHGASQSAKVPVVPTNTLSAQADGPERGKVKTLAFMFEQAAPKALPVRDLREHVRGGRKNNMKPKLVSNEPKRQIAPLHIEMKDVHATRSSGFASGSGSSKPKAAQRDIVYNLPLEAWSIGVDIPPHEPTPEPSANLIWERGFLKVQHMNSILFELQLKKGSLQSFQYVDLKKSSHLKPLIHILPSATAIVQYSSAGFKLGSDHEDGLLTFKFDSDASDWDEKLYGNLVHVLSGALGLKAGKSTLDRSGAKAVWEAVTRAHESHVTRAHENQIFNLDIQPSKASDSVAKPRARPKPRAEIVPPADIFVRRSARLSGVEQQPLSPRPDLDEVILTYRSGIGSLNITNGDVSRLKPGEFLNDTLIEFGLKLWLADLSESNPELASQVHVFSSFFYKKLSTKIPEDGYNSVRKWTSKFDLFQKKYIIVPINENMHWYLAIIYFPEHTLLPRPVQATKVSPRRSTRHLGVVVDSSDVKDLEQTPKQSLPADPDPPPSAQADSASRSGLLTPDSLRTEDQRDEIDVERMVESGPSPSDPLAKQNDGPCAEAVDEDISVDDATGEEDALTLLYPASPPQVQRAELPPLDHQGDIIEQDGHPASRIEGEDSDVQTSGIPHTTSNEKSDHEKRNATSPDISLVDDGAPAEIIEQEGPPASRNVSEGSGIRTPGIPPTIFYGKSNHRRRNVTSSEVALVDNGAPVEIVVEEDIIMSNPDSEHEETAEHPKTYIFTFDSLSSKHPQAVKRLSKYLLMEARDKKQLEEDKLNEPKGMQAHVPRQNNYCDCGIYLLHFAKTFMKNPELSSEIIKNRSSPQKNRRLPHEHWDNASVGSYREELAACIYSLSEEWKRKRSEEDAATKNQTEAVAAAPQEQSSTDPTPAASAKADDSDSEIEVLGSPTKKAPPSKAASRRDSGLAESRRKGTATRARGG
ncbi:hypothetical protein EI94DRAFT_1721987 [Lactarius quietus]|nr:hypothetical protein EI94DRAFT_1721987 [Lactarius quietus]